MKAVPRPSSAVLVTALQSGAASGCAVLVTALQSGAASGCAVLVTALQSGAAPCLSACLVTALQNGVLWSAVASGIPRDAAFARAFSLNV